MTTKNNIPAPHQANNITYASIYSTVEEFKRKNFEKLNNKGDILIIGDGEIGDKARELIQHESILKEVGFKIPKTVVLSQNTLNEIISLLGIGRGPNIAEKYHRIFIEGNSKTPQGIVQLIQQIQTSLDNVYLIVRSSGKGDSAGTGIYNTIEPNIHDGNTSNEKKPEQIIYKILRVLESYYSKSAGEYRKQANIGEGFGIILQEYIYQKSLFHNEHPEYGNEYAPIISGNGYTSTQTSKGAILTITPGGGGGVNGIGIHGISKERVLSDEKKSLYSVIFDESYSTDKTIYDKGYQKFRHLIDRYKQKMDNIDVLPLFEMLKQLELLSERKYIEFASTKENKTLKHYITQISPVLKDNADTINMDHIGGTHIVGTQVTGTGIIKSTDIIYCMTTDDVEFVTEMNTYKKDYILILNPGFVTGARPEKSLKFKVYSNAGVVLVPNARILGGSLASHFQGLLSQTGKILASIDLPNFNWDDYEQIVEGDFTVYSSEKQNKLAVIK